MHAAPAPPLAAAAARLWLARALAWSLLIGGWLALGALGQQQLPRAAGGLAPLALWLLAIGGGLSWPGSGWLIRSAPALRYTLLATAAAGAGALLGMVHWPAAAAGLLLLAAGAWAALLLAASCCVRALRQRQRTRPPSPVLPALAGAALAWIWAGDSLSPRPSPVLLGGTLILVALWLVGLLPRAMHPLTMCRAGLFDCSLPLLSAPRWHRLQDWPQAAAALSMLPMMVSLAVMGDWCASLPWLSGGAAMLTALHLVAMLGPALLLALWPPRRWFDRRSNRALALATGALLAAGGLALAWPGLAGLMVVSLLHGMAWSLAWAGGLRPHHAGTATACARPAHHPAGTGHAAQAAWQPAALTAAAVLALGMAIDHLGPAALVGVHGALALAGALGVFGVLVGPRRSTGAFSPGGPGSPHRGRQITS